MKMNFNEIEEKAIKAFQGGMGEFNAKIFNDGENKILFGRLEKNNSIGLHTHVGTSEIIYVISGSGIMECSGAFESLSAGDVHYCKMGESHTFKNVNDEPLTFFAVVPNHKVA